MQTGGRSALAAAAANGYLDCLEHFLYTKLFDINKQGTNGMAPSSSAVMNSYDHPVAALLREDLRPGLEVNKMDFENWSALFCALTANSPKPALRLLPDMCYEPNQVDQNFEVLCLGRVNMRSRTS